MKVADAGQQPCNARHVVGAGLGHVRQEVRHLRQLGKAAGAALQERLRRPPAQQKPRALGTVEPLVPRHGDEGGVPCLEGHRQRAGRLGGIHNQRHTPGAADGRDARNRQDIAENVGDMGGDDGLGVGRDGAVKVRKGIRRVKELPPGHGDAGTQGMERPHHGIVLKARDHHLVSRGNQGFDGDIQAMGCVKSEDHLLRRRLKEASRRLPAGKGNLRGTPRRGVTASAKAGAGGHGLGHRAVHRRGLLERGGRRVEIDHGNTSFARPPGEN